MNEQEDIIGIYKSGFVQIRGMYRRVWRPRYLEIRDDGTVRYHEVTKNASSLSTSSTALHSSAHSSNIQNQAASSTVFEDPQTDTNNNAEVSSNKRAPNNQNLSTSDELTLESIWEESSNNNNNIKSIHSSSVAPLAAIMSSSHTSQFENNNQTAEAVSDSLIKNIRLKAIMTIHDARLLNTNLSRDSHVSLPTGYYGFLFHGSSFYISDSKSFSVKSASTSSSSVPGNSRDFLCIVRSRTEAKKWVQALQWAAGLLLLPPISSSLIGSSPLVDNTTERKKYKPSTRSIIEEKTEEDHEIMQPPSSIITTTNPDHSTHSLSNSPANTTVLVTKIRKFRFSNLNKLSLELKLLKLHPSSSCKIEEWTYIYSYTSILQFIFQIQKEFMCDDSIYLFLINNLQEDLFIHKWYVIPHEQMKKRLLKLDEAMRFLSSHSKICNSTLFKTFLGLTANSEEDFISKAKYEAPPHLQSNEEIVKHWLWNEKDDVITFQEWLLFYIVSHPNLRKISCLLFMVLLLWHMKYHLNSFITLPISLFCTNLCMAFSWGYYCAIKYPIPFLKKTEVTFNSSEQSSSQNFHHVESNAYHEAKREIVDANVDEDDEHEQIISICRSNHKLVEGGEDVEDHNEMHLMHTSFYNKSKLQCVTYEDMEDDIKDNKAATEENKSPPDTLSSPLPCYPGPYNGSSCWSQSDETAFKVRGKHYLEDRLKYPTQPSLFKCRGVDVFMTYDPLYNISRHPAILGGKLWEKDTLVINFLLPFCNFVAYFQMNDLEGVPANVKDVWNKFVHGDQQYRDARLKMLPYVVEGPWIVRRAVGPGNTPAVLSKVLPLQYYITNRPNQSTIFEIDVIISASRVANAILNVVKGNTKHLTIAFAFIIEAVSYEELPENVIACFTMHDLDLEKCPKLPEWIDEEGMKFGDDVEPVTEKEGFDSLSSNEDNDHS